MSDPRDVSADENPQTSPDLTPDGERNDDPLTLPDDELSPESQGEEPLVAELGEDGQGDISPADEPETFTDDEEPRDLRTEI